MNKNIIVGFLAILVVVGGFILFSRQNAVNAPSTQETQQMEVSPTSAEVSPTSEDKMVSPSASEGAAMNEKSQTKTFNVEGSNFAFNVKEMKVKQGDTVKVVFTNKNGMHDWVLDEFNAQTKVIPGGQSDSVEFVASKKGTFEYYCSVGNHRQQGMVGKFIVE